MLKGGVLFLKFVVAYFVENLVADNMLVAEHVTDLTFIHGHAALISPVHGAAGMAVPVLHVVVLFFGELGELDLELIGSSLLVDSLTRFFTSSGSRASVVLNLVNESVLLDLRESSQERHKLREGCLVVL